jgi:hypothetical protein
VKNGAKDVMKKEENHGNVSSKDQDCSSAIKMGLK